MDWSRKRCVVLDMDGTVYLGHIPIKGAVGFIQNHWRDLDFFFLSNNTSKSPQTYVDKLNGMGIPARGELLLSPVTPLVDFLRRAASAGPILWATLIFNRICVNACPNFNRWKRTRRP